MTGKTMVYQKKLTFSTNGHGEMHDLTEKVEAVVGDSHIRTGLVHIFAVGSTAGICSIEFEPGLEKDLPTILGKLIPPSLSYGHEQAWHDGNGHSHLQASIVGPDMAVPVRDGKLVLGTWQQVVHVDFDVRGRQREVIVTVSGE